MPHLAIDDTIPDVDVSSFTFKKSNTSFDMSRSVRTTDHVNYFKTITEARDWEINQLKEKGIQCDANKLYSAMRNNLGREKIYQGDSGNIYEYDTALPQEEEENSQEEEEN